MMLLAHDSLSALQAAEQAFRTGVRGYATICQVERGLTLRNAAGGHIEHFGYVDGLSQPLFFTSDLQRLRRRDRSAQGWDAGAGAGPLRTDRTG
ncbi:MAG: hypothetical protein FJZ47_00430 [Candidatus Tectomicrobia bacterium]|uniref:Uncharacterized protein n=1 Tax=Tectimicrobiota bacterium TaxID=2528274 RepID=A0A937VY20_UNCTE|nr:hypothetical protein [Candidatus Tectomicrobia bacterium]